MVGWHHRLNGHEFELTPGVDDEQGDLASCNSWGRKESDTTEWLNGTEHSFMKRENTKSKLRFCNIKVNIIFGKRYRDVEKRLIRRSY